MEWSEVEAEVEALSRAGARRFSRWDGELFKAQGGRALRQVWFGLRAQARRPLRALGGLIVEAIGAGYVGREAQQGDGEGWQDLMSFGLLSLAPRALPRAEAAQRLALLAQTWNLGEGLAGQPAWLNLYVTSQVAGVGSLEALPEAVVEALRPALEAPSSPDWGGAFAVERVDLSAAAEDFLPGELYLAAPSVLCVRDRRHEDVQQAILLRRGAPSQPMGVSAALARWPARAPSVEVSFGRDEVRIAGQAVAMPWLRAVEASLVCEAGFVVASAVDSQCVWIAAAAR
jgi:hypothetical protein